MGKEVEAGVEVEEVRDDEKGAEDATSESIESKRREAARAEGAAAGDAARAKVTPTTQTWEMRDMRPGTARHMCCMRTRRTIARVTASAGATFLPLALATTAPEDEDSEFPSSGCCMERCAAFTVRLFFQS